MTSPTSPRVKVRRLAAAAAALILLGTPAAPSALGAAGERAEVTSGAPSTPPSPTAKTLGDGGLGGAVRVTWAAARGNGRPITGYQLRVIRDGTATRTIRLAASTRNHRLAADNGAVYSFRVRARNARGFGGWSRASSPVTPYGRATQVRTASAQDWDRSARVSWTRPADLRGTRLLRYEVRGPSGTLATTSTSVDYQFGANDGPYAVTIMPVTRAPGGAAVRGSSTRVEGIRPFGRPNTPAASASGGSSTVTLRWDGVAPNGRDVSHLLVSIDGGGWQRVANATGSRTVGNGSGQNHSIRVKAVDVEGNESAQGSASATSGQAPPARVRTTLEPTGPVGGCTASCRWIQVDVQDMRPGTYRVFLDQAGQSRPRDWDGQSLITVGSDGIGSLHDRFYTGFPGRVTVTVNGTSGSATPSRASHVTTSRRTHVADQ